MTPWPVLIGSISGVLVAAIITFTSTVYQQRRIDRREARASLGSACTELLTRSASLVHRAQVLSLEARFRTGLAEGVLIALGREKPLRAMQLLEWLLTDLEPAYKAWSGVWVGAPASLIQAANNLISACEEVIGAATSRTPSKLGRHLRELALGGLEDVGQRERMVTAVEALSLARREFTMLVREEFGQKSVEVFAGVPD